MMRFLLIDTCGAEGSIALAEDGRVVASDTLPGRSASERLVPAIRQMLEAAGWGLGELAAIGVVHGPGSFTGVRVGLSAAKGLSEAGRIPLIAVSRLALLAAAAKVDGKVCAVLDAGRGEFYCGSYIGRRKINEALLTAEEVATAAADGAAVVVCEQHVVDTLGTVGVRLVSEPAAGGALPFVTEKVAANEFDNAATVDANYLRRTDLEIFAKNAPLNAAKGAGR